MPKKSPRKWIHLVEKADGASPAVQVPGSADDGELTRGASPAWRPDSYLGMLAPRTREALLGLGVRRVFRPGQVFIAEGDADTDMFVLVDGIVKVTALSPDADVFVDVHARGDTVGELSALNPGPTPLVRSATVMAAGSVEAIQIAKRDTDAFFAAHADAAVAMAFMLGGRQRQKLRERLNMTGFDVKTRVARTLAALAEKLGVQTPAGVELGMPLSQIELANLAAVAEPTAQKALRDLRKVGAIETNYLRITITDMDALLDAGDLHD